jgi:hypothetical protein
MDAMRGAIEDENGGMFLSITFEVVYKYPLIR